ncbi:MAG: DUF2975 domain-containing protein [Culturomica sp.]|jgi:hypothetical protein|nr:DUF2975 domain-containing protein [Culturomica sp.]
MQKRQVISRLNLLYIAFFIILCLGVSKVLFNSDFKKGFNAGFQQGIEEMLDKKKITYFYASIPVETPNNEFHQIESNNEFTNTTISAQTTVMNFKVQSPKISSNANLLATVSVLCYLTVFILLFVIMLSIRKSIKTNDVFNMNNIKLIRIIGVLFIASSLLFDWARYIEINYMIEITKGTGIVINPASISLNDILIGILILVIAEIFNIGYTVTEEQKFTI